VAVLLAVLPVNGEEIVRERIYIEPTAPLYELQAVLRVIRAQPHLRGFFNPVCLLWQGLLQISNQIVRVLKTNGRAEQVLGSVSVVVLKSWYSIDARAR
jgi:hypothetical protein